MTSIHTHKPTKKIRTATRPEKGPMQLNRFIQFGLVFTHSSVLMTHWHIFTKRQNLDLQECGIKILWLYFLKPESRDKNRWRELHFKLPMSGWSSPTDTAFYCNNVSLRYTSREPFPTYFRSKLLFQNLTCVCACVCIKIHTWHLGRSATAD